MSAFDQLNQRWLDALARVAELEAEVEKLREVAGVWEDEAAALRTERAEAKAERDRLQKELEGKAE